MKSNKSKRKIDTFLPYTGYVVSETHSKSLIEKRIDDLENGSKVMRQDVFMILCINVF